MFQFLALADTLTAIGTVVTAMWGLFSTVLGVIETELATSIILQITLGVVFTFLGGTLAVMVIGIIKKIVAKKSKA